MGHVYIYQHVYHINQQNVGKYTGPMDLAKLKYFTNLDFPEIRRFPLLNHHLGAQVV